jgi:hypothetical protein
MTCPVSAAGSSDGAGPGLGEVVGATVAGDGV